jgi:hypothetical protein
MILKLMLSKMSALPTFVTDLILLAILSLYPANFTTLLSVAKYCFGVPPWDSYCLPPQVSYGVTLELSKKLLFLKRLLQNQNYR